MIMEPCQQQSLERPIYGFWQYIGRILQWLGQTLERRAQVAWQRQQLLQMDDRLLNDIGLSRTDAEQLAGRYRPWDQREHGSH